MLSMSIAAPIFFSMTSDIAPRDRRAAFFGYQAMAFSVCGIVGPLLGGFFFEHIGYRWFLVAGAALAFTASYLRYLIKDPRESPDWVPEGGRQTVSAAGRGQAGRRGLLGDFWANLGVFLAWARRTPGIVVFIILINIPSISGKLIESYFSVYMNEAALVTPAALGILFAISGAVAIPSNLVGGRLADRIGRRVAVSAAWILSGLWVFVLTLAGGYRAFMVMRPGRTDPRWALPVGGRPERRPLPVEAPGDVRRHAPARWDDHRPAGSDPGGVAVGDGGADGPALDGGGHKRLHRAAPLPVRPNRDSGRRWRSRPALKERRVAR
jgi:MFS family permease